MPKILLSSVSVSAQCAILGFSVSLSGCAKPTSPETEWSPPSLTGSRSEITFEPSEIVLSPVLISELQGDHSTRSREGVFRCTNDTQAFTSVTFVESSCSCIAVRAGERRLRRGDLVPLEPLDAVNIKLEGWLPQRPQEYSFEAIFLTETELGNRAYQRATLRCAVISDVCFLPGVLQFSVAEDQHPIEQTVALRRAVRATNPDWKTPRVRALPSGVRAVDLHSSREPVVVASEIWVREWQLRFRLIPTELSSRSLEAIEVTFDEESDAAVKAKLPIVLETRGDIVAPKLLHFGLVSLGGKAQRRVLVRSRGDRFAITDVSPTSANVRCTWQAGLISPRHWIDVSFFAAVTGNHQSWLTIATDAPRCQRIEVETVAVVGVAVEDELGKGQEVH